MWRIFFFCLGDGDEDKQNIYGSPDMRVGAIADSLDCHENPIDR